MFIDFYRYSIFTQRFIVPRYLMLLQPGRIKPGDEICHYLTKDVNLWRLRKINLSMSQTLN